MPIDYRFIGLLLEASQDPDVSLGSFAAGVRVGPGARLPRLPALYFRKKKWRPPRQADPLDYAASSPDAEAAWRRNYSSLSEFSQKVVEVLEDQSRRGQVIVLSEQEARRRFPNLTVASLGAQRKDKPGGVVTAPVLFDGTNGIAVNARTRIRDQERAPIAADLKRSMRESRQEVCVLLPSLQMWVKLIDKFLSMSVTGTYSGVRSSQGKQCTLTPWGPSVLLRHLTTGRE